MKRPGKWLAAHKAIEIVEEGGVRVLQIGGNAIQSAMRLDAPDRNRARLRARDDGLLLFRPGPREVLMVGLAGLDGALHPSAHAADARHGGRDQSGRGHRRAEILSLSREDSRLEIVIGDGS